VYYISNVFISREEKKMKRRRRKFEREKRERRDSKRVNRCLQFSFFVQEDSQKKTPKKKKRE